MVTLMGMCYGGGGHANSEVNSMTIQRYPLGTEPYNLDHYDYVLLEECTSTTQPLAIAYCSKGFEHCKRDKPCEYAISIREIHNEEIDLINRALG